MADVTTFSAGLTDKITRFLGKPFLYKMMEIRDSANLRANKVSSPTADDLVTVDSDGDIQDSGIASSDVSANTTHRSSDGKNHSDVGLNNTHRASDGKNHSDVVLNNTHRASDGKNHSDVVLNNTHRASDGKNHSDVVLNNTHRSSNGSDHNYIDQDVTQSASPTFAGALLSGLTASLLVQTDGDKNLSSLSKQSHIADPAGGVTQDAEARTAINAILLALETAGVLNSS